MPLIKCQDCGHDVSDRAPACPNCGGPMTATTIELTGKRHKLAQLICNAVAVVGGVLTFAGFATAAADDTKGSGLIIGGIVVVAVGAIGYTVSRAIAWWHHG